MTAPGPDLAGWCRQRAENFAEYERVEMAMYPSGADRDTALVEWTLRVLGNPELAESREVLNILADRHLTGPDPVARVAVPGEPLPPVPDSAYPPGATPLDAAIDADLRMVADTTGVSYEDVRELYDSTGTRAADDPDGDR